MGFVGDVARGEIIDVAAHPGEHPTLLRGGMHSLADLLGRREFGPRIFIGHQLDGRHQAQPAHFADVRMRLQRFQVSQQTLPQLSGALQKLFALENVEIRQGHGAADRMRE